MHPVLFKIGPLEIHAYGLMLALSFLLGIYLAMRRGDKRGIDRNIIMDLSLFVVIAAIFGSRFLYVITHVEEFRGRWLDSVNPIQSTGQIGIAGLSMLGGVVLALLVIIIFCWIKKVSLIKLGDIMAPSFALGIFLTRIGCFLNGCCFGKACSLPWAVHFPPLSPAGIVQHGQAIHPTQIYSSLYGLLILAILLFVERKRAFDGSTMALFFILYGLARFLIDFVRYYEESVVFPFLGMIFTINQAISFLMILVGLGLFIGLSRRARKKS